MATASNHHSTESLQATAPAAASTPFGYDPGVMATSILALESLIMLMLQNEAEQQKANGDMGTYAADLANKKADETKEAGEKTAEAGEAAMISGLVGAGLSLTAAGVGFGMGLKSGGDTKGLETEAQSDRTTLDKVKAGAPTEITEAGTLAEDSNAQQDLEAIDAFHQDLANSRSTSGIARTGEGTTLEDHIANIRKINAKMENNTDNANYSDEEVAQIKTRVSALRDKLDSNIKSYGDRIKSKTGKVSSATSNLGQLSSAATSIGSSVSSFSQAQGQQNSAEKQANATRDDAALNFVKGVGTYFDTATQKTVKQIGDLYAMLANISNSTAKMSSSVS